MDFQSFVLTHDYTGFSIQKLQKSSYFQINRYNNKTSNFEASKKYERIRLLTSLRYPKLWFSKMTTAGFTHTDIYPIELF